MESIIFRNDDVSPNSNLVEIAVLYEIIKELIPGCMIISGVTLFGRSNDFGTVYPGVPFKNNPAKWLYDVNRAFYAPVREFKFLNKIASHGLIHVDHSNIDFGAQEMSIISSCKYLGTDLFIPPFNRFNEDTEKICRDNEISLIGKKEHWKCMDFEMFSPEHKFWYFHSWRFTPKKLRECLNGSVCATKNSANVG